MINLIGANTGNLLSYSTYTTQPSSPTDPLASLLTDVYQPSGVESLSSSWNLLTQAYSPQSVLDFYQQQNAPTTSDSLQQQIMNEIQNNPSDTIKMEEESNLNNLVQSNLEQGQTTNLSLLAESYDTQNMFSDINLSPENAQKALAEIQSNPWYVSKLQQEEQTSQFLQSQFGYLGNNIDISI